jgi:Zn-dependent peptidase ImmA (M78 family)
LGQEQWSDEQIRATSKRFGVSTQVVLRRLLTLNKISQKEFAARQATYEKEVKEAVAQSAAKTIVVTQSTKAIAAAGKLFTRLVLESYQREKVTSADVSDLLSVRLQHLPEIQAKLRVS